MANWLSSEDAVIIFSRSKVQSCNKAAIRLFSYPSEQALLAQAPGDLLLALQKENVVAEEWLENLMSEARQEGFAKGLVIGRRSDEEAFYANLVVISELVAGEEEFLYCTKWLPLRSFAPAQKSAEGAVSFKVTANKNAFSPTGLPEQTIKGHFRNYVQAGVSQVIREPVANLFSSIDPSTSSLFTATQQSLLALEQSGQRLKDAFAVTRLSSWEYLVEEDLLLLNDQLRELLAIAEPLDSYAGSRFLQDFVLPEDQGKLHYLVKQAKEVHASAFKEIVDYRLRGKDGSIIHVLGSIRLELGTSGKILRAYGTAQDITQLRLTEQELEEYRTGLEQLVETRTQELRKSEEKLADALRLANLGTWEFDPVTACFLVSDNVLEIFGTTREIEGGNMIPVQRMRQNLFEDDRAKYLKTVKGVIASEDDFYTDHLELRIKRSNGEIRHLYVSIKRDRTNNFIKYYGTLQDISAMRQTEHEKDRLTAIVETTSDIIGIVGIEGQILYLNKAGKEFFGIRDEAALLQKTYANFQARSLTAVLSRKELRHADKWGTWSGQNRYIRHDGSTIHVSQVIVSHKNSEGQVQCYSTILRDMSEQKKIEQDLMFKNNELDTFIYRASHDLRGPIATMMGLNQIVRYEITDPAAIRYFNLYNSQIMRLHNITVSLIELTKIKDRNCEITKIDFNALWQETKAEIVKLPDVTDVNLEDAIEHIQDFSSDIHLLKVILFNLVANAVSYRRSDVSSLARVEIMQDKASKHVILKVSDNGIGIDGALQHKIFNMFFRGTERSKGPGLGLYILKNSVEKLNGRITLNSVPYKGTTFKIEIPSLTAGPGLSA